MGPVGLYTSPVRASPLDQIIPRPRWYGAPIHPGWSRRSRGNHEVPHIDVADVVGRGQELGVVDVVHPEVLGTGGLAERRMWALATTRMAKAHTI